jgi:hypothetical protein
MYFTRPMTWQSSVDYYFQPIYPKADRLAQLADRGISIDSVAELYGDSRFIATFPEAQARVLQAKIESLDRGYRALL